MDKCFDEIKSDVPSTGFHQFKRCGFEPTVLEKKINDWTRLTESWKGGKVYNISSWHYMGEMNGSGSDLRKNGGIYM